MTRRRTKGSPLPSGPGVLQVQLLAQRGVASDGTPNHQGVEVTPVGALKIQLPAVAAASSAPSGAAGGDLGGTYPNPTVANVPDGALSANVVKSGDAAGGDLTGTYRSPTIAKLQGNAVDTNAEDGSVNAAFLYFNGDDGKWTGALMTGDVVTTVDSGHASATVVNVPVAALPAGAPIQVVSQSLAVVADVATTLSALQSTGLSASITCRNASSKVFVQVFSSGCAVNNTRLGVWIKRTVGAGSPTLLRTAGALCAVYNTLGIGGNVNGAPIAIGYMDAPASALALTYEVFFNSSNNTDSVSFIDYFRTNDIAFIVLTEIAG